MAQGQIMADKILVVGSQGNLGQDLVPFLEGRYGAQAVSGTSRMELDLTAPPDDIRQLLDTIQPTVMINTAAYTNVDKAESEPEVAQQVNAAAPEVMAQWAAEHNAFFIHISTDYVFDGEKGRAYETTDATNPISVYGASKCRGEERVMAAAPNHAAVLRTSWLYGPGQKGFVWFVVKAAQEGRDIKVADDQWGTPTWTGDACRMIDEVIQSKQPRLYHACAKGMTNRYEQAKQLCELMGVAPDFMSPQPTSAFNFAASRPENTAMVSSFSNALTWQEAAAHFVARYQLAAGAGSFS